jgi:uncharacterized protein (TIGR02466 family)
MSRVSEGWIEASDVISMFPSLVWKIQLKRDLHQAINKNIVRLLERMRRELGPLPPGQGWQSEALLHQRDEFQELAACVMDAAKSVVTFLRIGYDEFEITGCWATVLAKGGRHKAHTHPNNYLSAVYYVRTHPGADTINFHDPRAQASVIRPPVTELTAQNTDQVVIKVADGTLLLFPSYLEHSVNPNESTEERISVSFNIMFSSFAQNLSKPLW